VDPLYIVVIVVIITITIITFFVLILHELKLIYFKQYINCLNIVALEDTV